jgi:hypothetical protein
VTSLLGCTLEEGFRLGRSVNLGLEGRERRFPPSWERKGRGGPCVPPMNRGDYRPLALPRFSNS